jgi:hypothetical protein
LASVNKENRVTLDQNSIDIKTRVIEGSRMRALQNNLFIMELSSTRLDSLTVELSRSEQYEITSINPIVINGLSQENQRGIFIIRPNIAGTITLNFKIGDKVKTHTISAQTENPYIFGNPVKDQQLFFGRISELSEIHRGVTKRNKQNFLITGPRRVGKTSLLYQLKALLQFPFISVFLTPESMGHEHYQMFRSILLSLREEIKDKLGEEPPPLDWDVKAATKETSIDLFNYYFERDLKKHINWLHQISEETRIVLLLDEANFLITNSDQGDVNQDSRQEFLRHLLQTYDCIACVLAGTPRILRMTSITSPLYNIFSGIKLKGFSREEADMLIREPARQINVRFDDDAVEKIIEFSGCSPYYIQALCSLSLENLYETKLTSFNPDEALVVAIPEVNAAISRILDMVDYGLKSLWDALEADERDLLKIIAVEPIAIDQANRELAFRLIDMNLINLMIRNQGTPAEKTYASIKAKIDEQWIKKKEE